MVTGVAGTATDRALEAKRVARRRALASILKFGWGVEVIVEWGVLVLEDGGEPP